MPIDARIPLGALGGAPEPLDVIGTANAASMLHARQQAMAMQAQEQRDTMAQRSLWQQAEGDPEKAVELFRQHGFGEQAHKLETQLSEHRQKEAQRVKAQLETQKSTFDMVRGITGAITNDSTHAIALQIAQQMAPQFVPMLGEKYDPATIAQLQQFGMDQTSRLELETKTLDALSKGVKTADEAKTLMGTILSTAKSPEQYAQYRESGLALLPSQMRAQLSPLFAEQFSPEAVMQAGEIAMSPKERADIANTAVDNLRQGEQFSETKRHNRAMENKPAAADNALVAIVGPDGKPVLVPRSQAIGKTPASTRDSGGGRGVTSGDANRIADFDTSLDDVKVLRQTISGIDSTGTKAAIGAALPNWVTEVTGRGTTAKQKQAVIDRVKQVIGKALEGGVLRKEDEYKYTKILPTISDTADVAKAKLDGLEAALVQRKSTLIDSLDDAGYNTDAYRSRGGGAAVAVPAPKAKPTYRFDPKTGQLTKVP